MHLHSWPLSVNAHECLSTIPLKYDVLESLAKNSKKPFINWGLLDQLPPNITLVCTCTWLSIIGSEEHVLSLTIIIIMVIVKYCNYLNKLFWSKSPFPRFT